MTAHRVPNDFLSAFEGGAAPAAPAPAPAQALQPAFQQPIVASQPHHVPFDANNPQVISAMALVRSQMNGQHQAALAAAHQTAATAQAQATATATQLKEAQDIAKAAERSKLPEIERLRQEIADRDAQMQATLTQANNNITGYQVQVELERIKAATNGEIEIHMLNTSSVDALRASVQGAQQAYGQRKQHMFQEFRQQYNLNQQESNQQMVEGLLPGPQMANPQGFPTPVNAQQPTQQPQQGQMPSFQHPQLDGGQSYAQVQAAAHGRVMQMAPGQGFPQMQPQYMQQASPVMQPQHPGMYGQVQPQNAQQWAQMQQMQQQPQMQPQMTPMQQMQLQQQQLQQQQQQQMMPGQQPQQQMAAPMPDAVNSVNGMGMRTLNEGEAQAAAQHAQAAVARHRGGPHAAAAGVMDQNGMGLAGAARNLPAQHPAAGLPLPQVGGGHPMNRNH